MESLEKWFYKRMIKELLEIYYDHKTNSLSHVISMLQHDYEE